MAFLRIHCHSCGNYWDVNEFNDYKHNKYKKCPHCGSEIDGQDFYNQVLPAFGAMMDANRELEKTHTGYSAPLFTVDFIQEWRDDDDDDDAANHVLELTGSVDALRDAVDRLTDALLTVDFVRKYK